MEATELYRYLPQYFMLKDKIRFEDGLDLNEILNMVRNKYNKFELNEVDGLKINFKDGCDHIRKSNAQPVVRLYIESQTLERAEKIKKDLHDLISII